MKKTTFFKTMLLLCALVVGSNSVWAADVLYKTLTFTKSNSTETSNYESSWTETIDDDSWIITNFNNNKWGWTDNELYEIRCGRKRTGKSPSYVYTPSVASITTSSKYEEAVTKVDVKFSRFNKSEDITHIKLYVASNSTFTSDLQTITPDIPTGTGVLTIPVTSPTANMYYKLEISTKGETSDNGNVGITKVDFYAYSSKTAAGLTFSPTSVTVAIGNEETIDFTKTTDATASFVVADETVATYNAATGKVTGLKEGTTTITATTAETSTYAAGMAVCTVTVIDPTWLDYTQKGYTNAQEITSETYAFGTVVLAANGGTSPKWYDSGTAVRIYEKNTITITAPTGYVLTSVEFSITSGSMSASNFNETVSKDGGTDKYDLNTPANSIVYSTSSNFRIDKVKLYIAAPVTISTAEYATYSNSSKPLDFSETGIKAFTAKDNGSNVSLTEIENGQVPANTPVVLYKEDADGTAINVPVIASTTTVIDDDDNDLVVSDGTTAKGDDVYVLAMNPTIGFYKWTSASSLSEGKIYLKAAAALGREFIGFDGETTGIESVKAACTMKGEYFNLNGQRVAQPTKGLYIVNGKKVVIK